MSESDKDDLARRLGDLAAGMHEEMPESQGQEEVVDWAVHPEPTVPQEPQEQKAGLEEAPGAKPQPPAIKPEPSHGADLGRIPPRPVRPESPRARSGKIAPIPPRPPITPRTEPPEEAEEVRASRANAPVPPREPQPDEFVVYDDSAADDEEGEVVVSLPAPPPEALAHQPPPRVRYVRTPLMQTMGFKRTLIPIFLTLGALCPVVAIIGLAAGPTSPYQVLGQWWFAVPMLLIGAIMLTLAVLTMLQVKNDQRGPAED